MGMIDVLPTLGNMLNIYSPYQLGTDIFSTNDNIVVFSNGSYLTNNLYYNSQKEEIYAITKEPIDKNYLNKNSNKADTIIDISNDIIHYDLIRKIEND